MDHSWHPAAPRAPTAEQRGLIARDARFSGAQIVIDPRGAFVTQSPLVAPVDRPEGSALS